MNAGIRTTRTAAVVAARPPRGATRRARRPADPTRAASSRPAGRARAPPCRLPADFLATLRRRHPGLAASANPHERDARGRGESHHPPAPPDAVVSPSSVEEVRSLLRLCCGETRRTGTGERGREEDVAGVEVVSVVPYGAGTSLEGHLQCLLPEEDEDGEGGALVELPSSLFTDHGDAAESYRRARLRRKGAVSLDMRRFQDIGEVAPGDVSVKVGAGVTRRTLNEALRCVVPCRLFGSVHCLHESLSHCDAPSTSASSLDAGIPACNSWSTPAQVRRGTPARGGVCPRAPEPPGFFPRRNPWENG